MNHLNTHLLHPVGVTTEPWHKEKSESFEADPSFGFARPIPIVNQDPISSEEMVEEAIASAEINAQRLTHAVRIYIAKSKYAEAKPWLEQLSRPGGGYTASQSEGNWLDPSKNTWVPEAIVVATSFMTAEMLQGHLALILQGCHLMGKALKEQAVAIEIISHSSALMLIIEIETE